MEILAEKSKLSFIEWTIGLCVSLTLSIAFSVWLLDSKQGSINVLMLFALIAFVLCLISNAYSIIWELRRPNVLIYRQDDYLNIYYKKHWHKEQLKNIVGVDFINSQSGRTILKKGTLTIKTEIKKYDILNVKNVAQACIKISNILYFIKNRSNL